MLIEEELFLQEQSQFISDLRDTTLRVLEIIEKEENMIPEHEIISKRALEKINTMGLRSYNTNILQQLTENIPVSNSNLELLKNIDQLKNEIEKADDILNVLQSHIYDKRLPIDKNVLRFNSKNEAIFDFQTLKSDYDLFDLLRRSYRNKDQSVTRELIIMNLYKLLNFQLEDMLKELEN